MNAKIVFKIGQMSTLTTRVSDKPTFQDFFVFTLQSMKPFVDKL